MGVIALIRFGNQAGFDPVVTLHPFRSRQVVAWRATKVRPKGIAGQFVLYNEILGRAA